ncbi:MAG: hypothetical protein Q4F84_04875, partial [Fibrobacter sp.]|nr:hypothetical protein [Fibrobacter sp.]
MAIDIIIVGALGRMGKEIAEVIFSDESVNLKGCVEYAGHPQIGTDYGVCLGKGTIGVPVVDSIKDLDFNNAVVIDFSTPKSTRSLFETVSQKKVPLVIGTTGLTDADV